MANIQYKTKEEQNPLINFNPKKTSIEKIDEYIYELNSGQGRCFEKMRMAIERDCLSNDCDVWGRLEKITDSAIHSTLFDERILNDYNLKSVDEIKLYDFNDERNFRDCLKAYHCYLQYQEAREFCINVLCCKLNEMISNSSIDAQTLINIIYDEICDYYNITEEDMEYYDYKIIFTKIYDGNKDNYYKFAHIAVHLKFRGFTALESLIHKIEQNF